MRLQTDAIDAIVLAGGVSPQMGSEGTAPVYKALLPYGEKLSIQYTLDALRAVPQIRRIGVVGPVEALRPALVEHHETACDLVPGGETLLENIYIGLRHFPDAPMVLMTTADLPLLNPAAITDFLAGCRAVDTAYAENMCFAVVPQQCFTGDYAAVTRPVSRFKDAAISYGNLFLVDPRLLHNTHATRRMDALYDARHNPMATTLAVGLNVGLSYVLGVYMWHLLTLQHMAAMASRRFGIGLIPVPVEHPEITLAVENPADYDFAVAHLHPAHGG